MAKPTAGGVSLDKLEFYKKLVATNPSVKLKGATVPYTSLNGHMFSYLSKEGMLALRLPAGEREAFLKKYKAKKEEGLILRRQPWHALRTRQFYSLGRVRASDSRQRTGQPH